MNLSTTPSLQMLTRLVITDLLDKFSNRVDRGESIAELLVQDARFSTPQWQATGRDEIVAKLHALAEKRATGNREIRHVTTSVEIDETAPSEYRVRSTLLLLAIDVATGENGVLMVGNHDDIVHMDAEGNCRFSARTMRRAFGFSQAPMTVRN